MNHAEEGYYPTYGVGAEYALTRNLAVRAEYERVDSVKYRIYDAAGNNLDVHTNYALLSAGMRYRF